MSNYKIAGTVFSLELREPRLSRQLREYQTEEPAEFRIAVTDAELSAARTETEPEGYSDSYLEWLAIYRKLCDFVLEKDILLFHGSAIAVDGQVYLFTAPSGTGKSTHTRLWREKFGERALMVNDDKPLLKLAEAGVTVYGTPWDGKHRLSANVALPLKALCILKRGTENRIRRITSDEALPTLLRQAYRAAALDRILPLVTRLSDAVPIYELYCDMSPEAVEVSWAGMQSQ